MDSKRSQVEKYRNVIVRNLIPSHVLPHLLTIQAIHVVKGEIQLKEKTSKTGAAEILIDNLLKSDEEGWYKIFLDALKEKGYEILSRTLEGYTDVKNPQMLEKLLSVYYVQLCDKVQPVELLSHLLSLGTIEKEDGQKIRADKICDGDNFGMLTLLDHVVRKRETWFADLMIALTKCEYGYIVKDIDPNLFEAANNGDTVRVQKLCAKLASDQERDSMSRMDIESCSYTGNTEVKEAYYRREEPLGASVVHRQIEDMDADVDCAPHAVNQPSASSLQVPLPEAPTLLSSLDLTIHDHSPDSTQSDWPMDGPVTSQQVPSTHSVASNNPRESSYGTSIDSHSRSGVLHSELHHSGQPSQNNASLYALNKRPSSTESPRDGRAEGGKRPSPLGAEASSQGDPGTHQVYSRTDVVQRNVDHSEPLSLRPYQLELAEDAVQGKNSIIVAPTGSGKTHVALYISQQHAESIDAVEEAKIVFVVPTVTLVNQQLDQYKKYLPQLQSVGLQGDSNESLNLRLPMYNVFVLTPQILLNALQNGDVKSLSEFTLIVFDECHHANKNHPYNGIMRCYFQEKQQRKVNLPQIVGLTASVGVGKTNNKDRAIEHILKICANLDSRLKTVERQKESLDQHVNVPDENAHEVHGRKHDPFHRMIAGFMTKIEERMKKLPEIDQVTEIADLRSKLNAPSEKGSDPYTGWVSGLKRPVAKIYNQKVRRVFEACRRHLKIYNDALLVNADCRTVDAWNYIKTALGEFIEAVSYRDDTDRWLEKIFYNDAVQSEIQSICVDKSNNNPKLEKVKELLLESYQENPDLRAIVFCKTREMTQALKNWMQEDRELRPLNADKLVGSHSATERGGMTACAQEDVIKFFRDGKHKVIIATTVAEEGLDIRKCSLVIRYQHVTNETSRIQAKGRGRDEDSKYMVVAERERGIIKEEINQAREKLMYEAMRVLLQKPEWEVTEKIKSIQLEEQQKAKQQEVAKIAQESLRQKSWNQEDDYELRCLKCDKLACFSSDIKHVGHTLHMVVSSDFDESIDKEPHPKPTHIKGGADMKEKIFCKECHSDWGITAVYQQISYPIIKISSFVIIFPNGQRDTCKKWVTAPFGVDPLTLEDREAMIEKIKSGKGQSLT